MWLVRAIVGLLVVVGGGIWVTRYRNKRGLVNPDQSLTDSITPWLQPLSFISLVAGICLAIFIATQVEFVSELGRSCTLLRWDIGSLNCGPNAAGDYYSWWAIAAGLVIFGIYGRQSKK